MVVNSRFASNVPLRQPGQERLRGLLCRAERPCGAGLFSRARLVTISAQGHQLVAISLSVVREVEAAWQAHLGPARSRQLKDALTTLREITDPFQ